MYCDHSNCKFQRKEAGNCFQDRFCLEYEKVVASRAKCRMTWLAVKRRFSGKPYTSNISEYHYYHPYRKTDFFGYAQKFKSPLQAMAYGCGNEIWHGLKCVSDHRDRSNARAKNEVNCCMLLERVSISTMRLIATLCLRQILEDAIEAEPETIPLAENFAESLIANEVGSQRRKAEEFAAEHFSKYPIGSLQWKLGIAYYVYAETMSMTGDDDKRRYVPLLMETVRRAMRIDPLLEKKLDRQTRRMSRRISWKTDEIFLMACKFKRKILSVKKSQDAGFSPAPTAYGDPGLDESSTAVLAEGVPHEERDHT